MRIGILGLGHVGRLTRALLGERNTPAFDPKEHARWPKELDSCDTFVICVGTPESTDGSVDLEQVSSAVEALRERPDVHIVLRSTVPPGTGARIEAEFGLAMAMWPEFIGEQDYHYPQFDRLVSHPYHIIGGPDMAWIEEFAGIVARRSGATCRIARVTIAEAELIKYMENCYFATKLAFVHEMKTLSDALGLNWARVREGWLLDPRIERDHSGAFHSDFAFGGRCLPKDVAGLLSHARDLGLPMPVLESVERWREKPGHDAFEPGRLSGSGM